MLFRKKDFLKNVLAREINLTVSPSAMAQGFFPVDIYKINSAWKFES